MSDINTMMNALRNADAAGDTEAATRIAAMIKEQRAKNNEKQKAIYLENLAAQQGPLDTFAIAAGKGLYDIGRGLGLVDPADEIEKQAYTALEKERPVSTFIGEVAGQSAPFLLPGTIAGAATTTAGRAGLAGLVGAAEGATIASAEGASADDILKTGSITGAISSAAEVLFPHIGRVAGRIYRRLKGVDAPTGLFTKDGIPTPEFKKVMADAGVTMDDVVNIASRDIGVDPKEALTMAQFDRLGIKPTLGELTGDINQLKPERFLMESTADSSADTLRFFKSEQSRLLKDKVDRFVSDLGIPEEAGEAIKAALNSEKAKLKSTRKAAYNALSQATKNVDIGVPLVSDGLMAKLPEAGLIRDVAASSPNQYKALTNLMAEFGIEKNPKALQSLVDSGVDITPLNIDNFESFRKRLGNIERADQTGMISHLTGPIRAALDDEVDLATKELLRSGNPDIARLAKEARQSHIALKTNFDDKAMTEILIKPKAKGSSIPNVEDSQVYNKLMATSTPVEQTRRVIDSIKGNERAMGNLQAQTLLDLIDSGFQASSSKIGDQRIFSGAAFQKRLAKMGDKLDIIFESNPKMLAEVRNLVKVAEKLTPPAASMPKGSAGFFIDAMDKLGLFSIFNTSATTRAIGDGLKSVAKASRNAKNLDKAINANPRMSETVKMIQRDLPSLAVILGISAVAEENDSE